MSETSPEPTVTETGYIPDMRRRQDTVYYFGYIAMTPEEIDLENLQQLRDMREMMAQ